MREMRGRRRRRERKKRRKGGEAKPKPWLKRKGGTFGWLRYVPDQFEVDLDRPL